MVKKSKRLNYKKWNFKSSTWNKEYEVMTMLVISNLKFFLTYEGYNKLISYIKKFTQYLINYLVCHLWDNIMKDCHKKRHTGVAETLTPLRNTNRKLHAHSKWDAFLLKEVLKILRSKCNAYFIFHFCVCFIKCEIMWY